jgi:hypothetical protein
MCLTLTTGTFDATTVDPTTVIFGRTGIEAAQVQAALEDVNGDGKLDLVFLFNTQAPVYLVGIPPPSELPAVSRRLRALIRLES